MSISIGKKDLSMESRKRLMDICTVTTEEGKRYEVFDYDKGKGTIKFPMGVWKNVVDKFPEREGKRIEGEFVGELLTKETDVKNRDQDVISEACLRKLKENRTAYMQLPCGTGKCLDPETKVMLYSGKVVKAKNIRNGDVLMGDDSSERKIVSVTEGEDEMYEIKSLEDGSSFIVNSSHNLTLMYERQSTGVILEVEVKDFVRLPEKRIQLFKLIANASMFDIDGREIDPNLLEYARLAGKNYDKGDIVKYCEHFTKNILFSNFSVRSSFYRGVIEKNEVLSFSNRKYAEDFLFLCRSLGGRPSITKCKKVGSLTYDIYNVHPLKSLDSCVSLMPFKVTPMGRGKYVGFTFGKGNGRFLLENHIVTHNTCISTYITTKLGYKTLVLCHLEQVNRQWKREFEKFTNLKVGIVKTERDLDKDVLISGITKAYNMTIRNPDVFSDIGFVIYDETHIKTEFACTKTLTMLFPNYALGLSATPDRSDKLERLCSLYFGVSFTGNLLDKPIKRHEVKNFKVVKVKTKFRPIVNWIYRNGRNQMDWVGVINSLAYNEERQRFIVERIKEYTEDKILVLSSRVEQCKNIHSLLLEIGEDSDILFGNKREYRKDCRVLVGIKKKIGVGFDDPSFTLLILADDVLDVRQNEGRIRTVNNTIVDIVDDNDVLESHWRKRRAWYEKRGAVILGDDKRGENRKLKDKKRFLKSI